MPTLAQLILSAFDSARTGYCGNRDGYIELGELLCACAPDVNNDGALDAREKALGLFALLSLRRPGSPPS